MHFLGYGYFCFLLLLDFMSKLDNDDLNLKYNENNLVDQEW